MWTHRTSLLTFENLDANRTATFSGECGEGADLYPFAHREYRRDQSMSSSPLSIRDIVCNISGKEQLPVLVSRGRNYIAAPLIAAEEEHLSFRVIRIHISVVPGNRGWKEVQEGTTKAYHIRHMCDRVYGSREQSADAL